MFFEASLNIRIATAVIAVLTLPSLVAAEGTLRKKSGSGDLATACKGCNCTASQTTTNPSKQGGPLVGNQTTTTCDCPGGTGKTELKEVTCMRAAGYAMSVSPNPKDPGKKVFRVQRKEAPARSN